MGIFSSGGRRGPRHFSYEPRFYNPEKDEGIKRRMRIQSKARRRRSPTALLYLLILLTFSIYIYMTLT